MDEDAKTFADQCALRLDYHEWVRSGPDFSLQAHQYSDACIEARELLEADVLLKMGSLYQLQRSLGKWGLDMEPRKSPYYWIFYELVLDLYDKPVPEELRRKGSRWDEVEDREAMAERVREKHQIIDYDWESFA